MTVPRTLWLHVGTHKTGTTSIQSALQEGRPALRKSGILVYPEKNAWRLANLFLRADLTTTPRLRGNATPPEDPETIEAGLEKMRRLHARWSGDIVISSEEFCMMRTPAEATALRTHLTGPFDRVVPIVAFRATDGWRASRRNQLTKNGTWEAQKALPDAQSNDGPWYYDTRAIMDFWGGIGPVRTLDYDAAVAAGGSILPDFARAIDRPGLFDGDDTWLNARAPAHNGPAAPKGTHS